MTTTAATKYYDRRWRFGGAVTGVRESGCQFVVVDFALLLLSLGLSGSGAPTDGDSDDDNGDDNDNNTTLACSEAKSRAAAVGGCRTDPPTVQGQRGV